MWKDGRRYRMVKSRKKVVDARAWSALLSKQVNATRDTVSAAKVWQARQQVARSHGEEVDLRRSKQPFAAIAAQWWGANPAKRHGSLTTDRHRLWGRE
jgi:hypothetical protein